MRKLILVLAVLVGISFIAFQSDVFALTESECASLSNLSEIELNYTVLTCQFEFDVIVNMGQRFHIQNPEGGGGNMLPSASVGGPPSTGPGVYQYSSGDFTGTVTLQNPPNIGVSLENVQTSFSGSQLSVSGDIVNTNNFAVKDLYVYWHITDGSGNYLSSWQRYGPGDGAAYSAEVPAQSTGSFSETMCCGNEGTVTPYIVQAFQSDGTPLIDAPIYVSDTTPITPLTINSLEIYEDGIYTRFKAQGDAPPTTDLKITITSPDGVTSESGSATGAPSYNHDGLVGTTDSLTGGTWNFKICAPEYEMCVEKTFSITASALCTPTTHTYADGFQITSECTIRDDSTGGDCTKIGEWNASTKTCKLTKDLTVEKNVAIAILTSGITLDGNGHTLKATPWQGPEFHSGTYWGNYGVWISTLSKTSVDNVVVKNLNIDGFLRGIFQEGAKVRILDNKISNAKYDSIYSHGITQGNNQISGNTLDSLLMWYPRGNSACTGSNSFVVSNNIISGGIVRIGSSQYTGWGMCFDSNQISGTMQLRGGADDIVKNNKAGKISVSNFLSAKLESNQIKSNQYDGLNLSGSSSITISKNTISENGRHGLSIANSKNLIITENIIQNNVGSGIKIDSTSTVTQISGNTVTNNGKDYDGITPPSGDSTGPYKATSPLRIQALLQATSTPDPTGGDCTKIGEWDASTKTCKLTKDILVEHRDGGIIIPQAIWPPEYSGEGHTEKITINGNGHKISGLTGGDTSNAGVYLYKTHFATVKNLTIENFHVGINVHQTNGVKILDNTIRDTTHSGIYAYDTGTCPNCGTGLIIKGNTLQRTGNNNGAPALDVTGFKGDSTCSDEIPYFMDLAEIGLPPPGNNPKTVTVKDNTIENSKGLTISLPSFNACISNNKLQSNVAGIAISGTNNIIKGNTITQSDSTAIGIVRANGNTIQDNIITAATGVNVSGSADGKIEGNTFSKTIQQAIYLNNAANYDVNTNTVDSSGQGIQIDGGGGHKISFNKFSKSVNSGIRMTSSSNDIFENNFSENKEGILILSGTAIKSSKNTIRDNNFNSNTKGISLNGFDNIIYNNNFVTNGKSLELVSGSTGNKFDQGNSIGGNYWSNYDESSEGCENISPFDVFCDAPLVFSDGQDSYPWILPYGASSGEPPTTGPLDNVPPVVVVPSNIAIEVTSNNPSPVNFAVSASDDVDGEIIPICSKESGSNFSLGTTTVTCTVVDKSGNIGKASFDVSISLKALPTAPFTILDDEFGGDCWHIGEWKDLINQCKLTKNIETSGNGIIIGSDNITLVGDVNNPTQIIGAKVLGNSGIVIDGKSNVRIANIIINSFEKTIEIKNSNNIELGEISLKNTEKVMVNNSQDVRIDYIDASITGCVGCTMNEARILSQFSIPKISVLDSTGIIMSYVGDETKFNVNVEDSQNVFLLHSKLGDVNLLNSVHNTAIAACTFDYIFGGGTPDKQIGLGRGIEIIDNEGKKIGFNMAFAKGPLKIEENRLSSTTFEDSAAIRIGFYGSDQYPNDYGVGNHMISNNEITNFREGIHLEGNSNSKIIGNTFINNEWGIRFTGSQNNLVKENNFSQTKIPVMFQNTINSGQFAQPPKQSTLNIIQENYWTGFDSAQEGCYNNSPFDKYCDINFIMTPDQYYPFTCTASCASMFTLTVPFEKPWVLKDGAMPSSPIASPPDTTKPTVSVPSSQTFQTLDTNGITVNFGTVTATDDRGIVSGPTCDKQNNSVFPVGTTTVTCKASDAAGNTGESSFTITVNLAQKDTVPPTITVSEPITLQTTNPKGTVVKFSGINATDNVGIVSGPTCSPSSGSIFPLGNTTVTCSAKDKEGNTGFASFWVNVIQTFVDDIGPILSVPQNISLSITNSTGTIVNYANPTATDNVGVTVSPYCTPKSGTLFPVGTTTVTCKAGDAAGNTGSKSFTVTVINTEATGDSIPPTVSQNQDIFVKATTANGAKVSFTNPTVTDNVDSNLKSSCSPSSDSFFAVGVTTVVCSATDSAGNTGSSSFDVNVEKMIQVPVSTSTISVSLSKQIYDSLDPIFVTGKITPATADKIFYEIKDSLFNTVGIGQITSDNSGSYEEIILPNQLWNANGTYTLTTTYDKAQASSQFEFVFIDQTVTESINVPTKIDLSSDKTEYNAGEKISINSKIDSGTGYSIILSLDGPSGKLLLQPLNTNSDGKVNLDFSLPDELLTGFYTLSATSKGQDYDLSSQKKLMLVAPVPEVKIEKTSATTENGQEVTQYNAGELAFFNTKIETDSSTPVLITVNVFDQDGNSLGVGFFKSLIGEGESEIVLGFELPENLVDGVANVYTNIFTDWPDQGGIPVTDELSTTVNIVGIKQETPVNENIPQNDNESIVSSVISGKLNDEQCRQLAIDRGHIPLDEHVICQFPFDVVVKQGERVTWIDTEPSSASEVTIVPAQGSGGPGCEETEDGCYIPKIAYVEVGGKVIMSNTDSAAHTFTSGTPSDGPDGVFDSSLLMVGGSFEWSPTTVGEQPYFCMVHPWKIGTIIVTEAQTQQSPYHHTITSVDGLFDFVDMGSTSFMPSAWGGPGVYEYYDKLNPGLTGKIIVAADGAVNDNKKNEDKKPVKTDVIFISPNANLPSCLDEDSCISPKHIQIPLNQNVTWNANFPVAIVSGNMADGPDGKFNLGLRSPAQDIVYLFTEEGTFEYFDLVHPWIGGKITVGE